MRKYNQSQITPTILAVAVSGMLLISNVVSADEGSGVTPEVLFKFTGGDEAGAYPGGESMMPPMLGKVPGTTEGYLYGAAGNTEGNFTATRLYKFDPDNVAETYTSKEFYFDPDGYSGARASLIEDAAGYIYTSMMKFDFSVSGFYAGQYAKINPDDLTWEYISEIPESTGEESSKRFVNIKGEQAKDADGNIYFPAKAEGSGQLVLLVRMTPETGAYTVVRDFETYLVNALADQSYHIASVIYSEEDDALYTLVGKGRSNDGDTKRGGVLVKIPLDTVTDDGNSPVDVLYTLDYTLNGYSEKALSSQSTLLEDGDFIYGTTKGGETAEEEQAQGTVWRFNKSTKDFSVVHYFGVSEGDGANPYGALAKGDDGNIYGTTDKGGTNDSAGTLYRINVGAAADRSDDSYELLHSFTADADGSRPSGLIDGGLGILYGSARTGGDGFGTVYKVEYPLPEVTFTTDLTVSAMSAETGDVITLSWAVENASSCVAGGENGDIWADEQELEGTDVEVTLTTAGTNTFTLTCNTVYEGGEPVSSSTVSVEVSKASKGSSSSGGGAVNPVLIMMAGLVLLYRRFASTK